jgi:hypothetical protein
MRIIKTLLLFFIFFQIIYAKEIKQNDTTFFIDDATYKQLNKSHPDLILFILLSVAMDNDSKQHWFNILPLLKKEHIDRLREILVNEKKT